ncbi:MAG TPA: ribonuclease Z [Mycobacteriales bacterium]|nr:ribonuclease Z [Mycobacteriales bacterium]
MEVVLLGTGSPLPDPDRAGPSTLVVAGEARLLVDAGRGVLMRAAAVGVSAAAIDAILLTHLHSDHITDLNDVITSRWVTSFAPSPLTVIGPPGTGEAVDGILAMLRHDISYRLAHHGDLTWQPPVEVREVSEGECFASGGVTVTAAPTDHRPVEPSVGFRIQHGERSVVLAGDTVPCPSLDALCAGADVVVHTAIRADVIATVPLPRLQDVADYHSSVEQAAQTAQRAGASTLVLTHYVPALTPADEPEWRARAAAHFSGRIELGNDLLRVEV